MIILKICVLLAVMKNAQSYENISLTFPEGFLIGTASSAYQVEGAWNISDKSESNWDYHTHNNCDKVQDRSSGDVSTDSYYHYKDDVKLMAKMGFDFYRFSISWTRILPTGYPDIISQDGLRYYHNLLDELEKHKIEPFVTIYHWDHPQKFEDEFGGWLSERMPYLFSDYARIIFKEFGSRVKFFATVNEPYIYCVSSYKMLNYPPGINLTGRGDYYCVQNMLKAHALAYHTYKNEFREKYNGKVSIVIPAMPAYPVHENDTESSDISFEFQCGMSAHPIFSKEGDYPQLVKDKVAERSKAQGYVHSRLPTLSDFWVKYIRGTADYFALNHYTSLTVEPLPKSEILNWPDDLGLNVTQDPKWATAQSPWLKVVPEGLGDLLRTIKKKYDNPPVYILENGVSDGNRTNDIMRIDYIRAYLKEMLLAIKQDGCNVKAYTYWSFLDSFEWSAGYTEKFGLIEVDFNRNDRKRTPKKSAVWFRKIIKCRKLYDHCGNPEQFI